MPDTIEYFYSAHSSYTYLGSARFAAIADAAGRRVVHRPVDLNKVLEGAGSAPFSARSDAFRSYFFGRELQRWSEYRGAPIFGRPRYHHHDTTLANCLIIAAAMRDLDPQPLAHGLLQAHWRDDADLADAATLHALAASCGLDADALLEAARGQDALAQYHRNTEEAIARSMFGAPTYFLDGDMFYGQDRLEMLERALEKPFASGWSST